MSKFKVGDRVIGIGIYDGINIDGKTGTVFSVGYTYGVNFDEDIGGWESIANDAPQGHAWGVEESQLNLMREAKKIQSSRKTLPLSSIHITSAFSDHLPDPKKITKCYEFYKANGEFNKDIVINMRNVLVDGYVAYLVAKMLGMKNVPVLQTNSDTLDKPKKAKELDFDWDAFKAGKIAVHCDTEEKAKDFLKSCHARGMSWCSGGSLLSHTSWEEYQKDTCYINGVEYSPERFYRENGYKIVEFPFPADSKPAPEKPAKAAPKFKVGDKVKVVKNVTSVSGKDGYIGNVYEIRNIQEANQYGCKYGIGEVYVVYENELEPYSEPAPASTEPDKQEAVKLYCVKDNRPGIFFTKGKTYTFDSNGIIHADGVTCNKFGNGYDSLADFFSGNRSFADVLVPLVKRPAKVGEWALITAGSEGSAWNASHEIYNGSIYNVVGFGFTPIIKTADESDYGWSILDGVEYLVLDGYQPEPEKPKYYSGKVVCVSTCGVDPCFTVGKVYEYRDGLVNCEKPKPYNEGNPAKTKEEALNRALVTFIELKQ